MWNSLPRSPRRSLRVADAKAARRVDAFAGVSVCDPALAGGATAEETPALRARRLRVEAGRLAGGALLRAYRRAVVGGLAGSGAVAPRAAGVTAIAGKVFLTIGVAATGGSVENGTELAGGRGLRVSIAAHAHCRLNAIGLRGDRRAVGSRRQPRQ